MRNGADLPCFDRRSSGGGAQALTGHGGTPAVTLHSDPRELDRALTPAAAQAARTLVRTSLPELAR